MSRPIPAGFVRHADSGCIIPESEIPAHEAALAGKVARRSIGPTGTLELQGSVDAKVAELRALEAKLNVKLAEARAAVGEAEPTPAKKSKGK